MLNTALPEITPYPKPFPLQMMFWTNCSANESTIRNKTSMRASICLKSCAQHTVMWIECREEEMCQLRGIQMQQSLSFGNDLISHHVVGNANSSKGRSATTSGLQDE
jgi:hypothetical protein